MSEHAADRALPPTRHEPKDIGLRFMLGLFALIGGTLVVMLALAFAIFPGAVKDLRYTQPLPDFPSPRLQPSPRADMQEFYAQEMARLNSAGWVDRRAQTVRIPIEQAMRAVAAEGIAGWPSNPEPMATSRAPIANNHSPVATHSAVATAQAPVRRHRTERVSRLGSR
jgi:hypothetical protein